MNIKINKHSETTKISDLLFILFSFAFSMSSLCNSENLISCVLFFFSIILIILIKYLKLIENE